jgi:putative aldouronate transport system substrate-binding protein
MKNMKSRFMITGIAVILCLALSGGCTKQASGTAAASAGTAGALSTLPDNTLKIKVSVPTFGTDPGRTAVQQEWLKRVEAYLGCEVEITWTYTPWADYRNNEQVILASGALPDACT